MIRVLIGSLAGAVVVLAFFAVFLWNSPVQAAECGKASWYGEAHHGKPMRNGKPFNMHAMTAASNTLPLGTKAIVRNVQNGKFVQVTITDTGAFHRYGRIIDLSRAAFASLAPLDKGIIRVCVTRLH